MMGTDLTAQVAAIPDVPGVYLFSNATGDVVYVGKATRLKSRVRSYFGSPRSLTPKTRALVTAIADIEYLTTATEQEAFHLEATLVKRHQPFYNVRLKDDKHYPYLKIDVKETWPRVYITRRVERDGARYFGPYASAKSVRTTLDLVKKLFPWRSCTKTITGSDPRPCLDYYIRRCIAPCTSYCTAEEYREVIAQVILFLEGRTDVVLQQLKSEMRGVAEQLDFERAARLRDQIRAVERVTEAQITATTEDADIDVFGLAQDGNEAMGQVFFVRGTRMTGGDHFALAGAKEEAPSSVFNSFLKQFYDSAAAVPRLVLIPHDIDDQVALADWLTAKRGSVVEVRVPRRGDKRRLVQMATENARESLQMDRTKWMADRGKTSAALEELEQALNLKAPPQRVECYDISNTQGSNSVASMVVFLDGQPAPKEYRRFEIKTVEGANDFASMAEVLERRFKRLAESRGPRAVKADVDDDEHLKSVSRTDDNAPDGDAQGDDVEVHEGWGARPDLVIVDGGKGQLSSAHDVMRNLGLDDLPLAGLAKREEELFVVDTREPIRLDRRSQGLYLVQRIRDEAHRFAITYHRNLRSRRGMQSALDSVPGIGPKRKKALLKKFGSVKGIREADVNEVAATPGLTQQLAATIKTEL